MQKKDENDEYEILHSIQKKIKDGELIKIKNETYNYYISTNFKNLNYFTTSQKNVTFIDPKLKIEKRFIISKIKESSSESLGVSLAENQGFFTSLLTCFEIVKLKDESMLNSESDELTKMELIKKLRKEKLRKTNKIKENVYCGEPILLKSVVNNMYLAIKKLDQRRVVLAHLEDGSCEFIFVFEKILQEEGDSSIKFNESIRLRSLSGGTLSFSLKKDYLENEKQLHSRVLKKDEEELELEEILTDTIKEDHSDLKNTLENVFETKKDRFVIFKCETVSSDQKSILIAARRFTKSLIEFYSFFQDWGLIGGKELKEFLNQGTDFRIVEDSTYYSYEQASKMQRILVIKVNKFERILLSVKKLMEGNNAISDINKVNFLQNQDLLFRIKQKTLRDMNFFELLGILMKLILKKLFLSLNLTAIFNSKFDTEKKKKMKRYSSSSNSKLKRILFQTEISWNKLKNTPQHIVKQNVYSVLKIILDLFYLGVKNNPENVEILSNYQKEIYYLLSFLPEKSFKILLELAKYKKFKDQNHIVHWIEKLEVIGERKNNIKDQIKYLKILREFCKDNEINKNLMRIQKRIRIQLFNIGTNPMKRGVLNFHQDENLGRAIIKIFKPNYLTLSKIIKIEPKMRNFRFKKLDNHKFSWDFGCTHKSFMEEDLYKDMISYIEEYIFLMIEMSQEENDESLNQIKNIGLTRELCKNMILDPSFPVRLKHSLLEMYLKVYMNSKKTIKNFDDLSFCFEKLDQVSLLSRSIYWMNINEIKTPEFLGQDNLMLIETFFSGDFLKNTREVRKQCDCDFRYVKYYLKILSSVLKFIECAINFGHTDVEDNVRITTMCSELLVAIFYEPIRSSDYITFHQAYENKKLKDDQWYLVVITTAIQIDAFHRELKNVILKILDILLTISKIRLNLQVLSFLKMFKVTYRIHRKFQCSISEFERLFTIYNFERSSSMRQVRKILARKGEKGDQKPARNKIQQKMSKMKKSQIDTDEEINILSNSTGVGIIEEIFKIYYDSSLNYKNIKGDVLSDETKINKLIKSKIFEVSNKYFLQREVFYEYIQKVQVFVGPEEFNILKDFDGDLQAYNIQIVSITRLSEQIEQILLDDVSMKNKLKNMSSKNYELRILELTNILNKILGRLIERLSNKNMFRKTQNFMRILKFHEILIKLFKINYNEKVQGHKTMLEKTIQFFEYFTLDNEESKKSLVPYTRLLINVISKKLKVARVISHIFSALKSIEIKKKLLSYLFKKISNLKINIEEILNQIEKKEIKNQREILAEYIKLIRTFMISEGECNKTIQRYVMEHILMDSVLYHFLIPETIEKIKNKESLGKMSKEIGDSGGLLTLLHEIYSLVSTLIASNANCIMILKGIISEENIRNIISSDKIHLILRKNFIRIYFEAFIVPQFDELDLLEDHEDIYKFLSYINDSFLKRFQNSLVWINEFGLSKIKSETKKEVICKTVEGLTSGGEFKFNYEKLEKYKNSYSAVYKEKGLGRYFWECLAHGEAWSYSFDGVLLILIDIFEVCFKSNLNLLENVNEILKDIKINLKNLLFSVIQFSDKFEDVELEAFLFILNEAYWMVPLEKDVHILPIKYYKFRLCLDKQHLEFIINKAALRDKASKSLKRRIREKNLIKFKNINKEQLTPDEISELMSLCFIRHLTENNLQLYQTFNIFVSNDMFDVCSKLRMLFNKYGLKFNHVKTYIDDSVYNSVRQSGEILDITKIVKKLTKDIIEIQNFGRKKVLREQKNKKINLNFEYIQNIDIKAYEYFKPNEEDREFSLNPENIFSDLKKMRGFAKDMISDRQMQCGFSFLIRTALGYFRRRKNFEFNPFDLLIFFATKMLDSVEYRSKKMLEMLRFFNLIFKVVETFSKMNIVHNHFERFLDKLIHLELHKILFKNFEKTLSLNILIENLELMINLSKRNKDFRILVYHKFMNERDILLHTGKLLIGRGLMLDLHRSLNAEQEKCKFLDVTKHYLEFVQIVFEKVNQECSNKKIKTHADKIAFLLLRRLCEFQVTLNYFFKQKSTKIFIVELNFRLIKCILTLLQIVARYIEFTKHHTLNSIFSSILNKQLSLSNNLEDERVIFLYSNCIKLLNLLITRFDIEDTRILLDNLNIESIVTTMSLIYATKIKEKVSKEKICKFCEKLTTRCTFYTCSLGRIPRNIKILRDIGMNIFTVLLKLRILFPNEHKLFEFKRTGVGIKDLNDIEEEIRLKVKQRGKRLKKKLVIDKGKILRKLKMLNPLFRKATIGTTLKKNSEEEEVSEKEKSSVFQSLVKESEGEEEKSSEISASLTKMNIDIERLNSSKKRLEFSRANSDIGMEKRRRRNSKYSISSGNARNRNSKFKINLKEIQNTEQDELISNREKSIFDKNITKLQKSSFYSSSKRKLHNQELESNSGLIGRTQSGKMKFSSMFKHKQRGSQFFSSKSIKVKSSDRDLKLGSKFKSREEELKSEKNNSRLPIKIDENKSEENPLMRNSLGSRSESSSKMTQNRNKIRNLNTIESKAEEEHMIEEKSEEEAESDPISENSLKPEDLAPQKKNNIFAENSQSINMIVKQGTNLFNNFEEKEEAEIDQLFENYKRKLREVNINQAYTYYSKHVQFLQLAYTSMFMSSTNSNFIKTTLFYTVPETAFFMDKDTTENLKYELIRYPANLRKKNILKRVSLVISIIQAKQKLFSRKGISFVLKFLPTFRFFSFMLIVVINILILLFLEGNSESEMHSTPLEIINILTLVAFIVYFFLALISVSERILLANIELKKYLGKLEVLEENYKTYIQDHKFLIDNKHIWMRIEIFLLKIFIAFLKAGFLRYIYSLFEFRNLMIIGISYLCFRAVSKEEFWPQYFSLFITLFINKTIQNTIKMLSFNTGSLFLYILLLVAILHNYSLIIMLFYREEIEDTSRFNCDTLLQCFLTTLYNSILRKGGGLAYLITEPELDSPNYVKNLGLKISFSFVKTLLFSFFFFGIIVGLKSFREVKRRTQKKLKKECLICGISREYLDSCGMSWKRHISNEHNFKRVFWYLIYLLELTKQDASTLELKLRKKVEESDESLFDDLRVDQLIGSVPDFSNPLYHQ